MKRKLSQFLVLAGAIGVGLTCNSAYSEDARVLPAGRSRLSFIYAQTGQITQQFNDQGIAGSIAAPYNLQLDAANVKSVSPAISTLVDQLNKTGFRYDASQRNTPYHGVVASNDQNLPLIGDALSRGFLGVGAYAQESQYNIAFQYGVTDRLSVGFLVPIVKAQTNINASLTGQNSAQDIQSALQDMKGSALLASPVQDLANVQIPTIQTLLQEKGYHVPNQTNQSGIGDVVFGGRYNYYRTRYEDVIASVQAGIVAPTGALRDPTTPTQIDIGSGAWDIGMAHITNYSPLRFITLSNGIHYDHRLPSHRNLIVDSYPGQQIPPASNEENVAMQLGDKYWTNAGLNIKVTQAITFSGQYEWFWKRPDTYQGNVPGRDYTYLSDDTRQYSETIQAGVSISTIPAFLKKDFPVPTDMAFNVYIPRAGMNTVIAPYGTAELALYF